MSIITDFLKLFKYDPETDGASTFNIKQCLNDNWDKIDAWASGIKTTIAGLVPGTRKVNGKELSADVTLTGDDIKTSASDETTISSQLSNLQSMKLSVSAPGTACADLHTAANGLLHIAPSGAVAAATANAPNGISWAIAQKFGVGLIHTILAVDCVGRVWVEGYDGTAWNGWRQLAAAELPQIFDLPLAEGWTGLAKYYKTQENICFIELDILKNATIQNGEVLATLPEGFRPSYLRMQPAIVYSPHGSTTIGVSPTGSVLFGDMSGSPSARNIYATLVFVAAS